MAITYSNFVQNGHMRCFLTSNWIGHLTGFGGQLESRTGFQPLCCDERMGWARGARVGTSRRSKRAPVPRDKKAVKGAFTPTFCCKHFQRHRDRD